MVLIMERHETNRVEVTVARRYGRVERRDLACAHDDPAIQSRNAGPTPLMR